MVPKCSCQRKPIMIEKPIFHVRQPFTSSKQELTLKPFLKTGVINVYRKQRLE